MNTRKSAPVQRSMISASTQCAEVGWYSKRVPGSQLQRHCENRASRRSRSSQSSGSNGARGNPDVCSITCSMVIVSLSFGANSGITAATGSVTSSRPFTDEDPHRARDDRLRRGEHDVARLDRRVAERAPHRDPAVARQRDLARRQAARVDVDAVPG